MMNRKGARHDGCGIRNHHAGIVPGFHRRLGIVHPRPRPACRQGGMMENIVMGLIGLGLIGFLFYTLFRPDRF
jgi:K+-transporting ATPase KdpF subunit